ncbi:MAG: Protein jag [Microgenomates group bacterium GW2011_GWA1_48_10]|uniref:R3H domain-containing protein n=1 Tax=Candidatus Gottesmanbacteria bacterium RIFCSPHIGHO2_01_FULL_47_48 TaxID=1798381 RepID=A0A1F6A4I5_9BACT|nr:MAG: Protein jag [Microgenomates group bacterium GW2011_GWA1_48_10]OGG19648.1 MAG: hypothetical protein A2721_00845 [Candidatus Gottesmanbacteria bacterium RIFCSPHIGHO2_01_FULL_47_48]
MAKSTKTKVDEKRTEVIKEVTEELLLKMGVVAGVEVMDKGDPSAISGQGDLYQVNLATEESGLLIGYHGETLQSFQVILGQLVFKRLGEWVRVVVEVGDYRAKREEQLTAMAQSWAAQAISTGLPVYVPFLPPGERRIVHLALQGREDVESYSEGEGRNRRLVIKAKVSSQDSS